MKKKNAFLLSALILSVLAITTLLIIYGVKGELAAFFTSRPGMWTIIAVVFYLGIVAYLLISDRIKNL